MNNNPPFKRLMLCATIAFAAVGLGIYNILYTNYVLTNAILQLLIAAAGVTAIGEIFAALSRFPIISYIISAVICSAALQAMTPWYIIRSRVDFSKIDQVSSVYRDSERSCLAVYSIALAVSILFGIFVLHRKDIFKTNK